TVTGRILHVRLQKAHHSIDIVGIYQHALHLEARKQNLHQRHQLWDQLGSVGTEYATAVKYPDAGEFAALLEVHSLVVLNSWVRHRHQHTFVGAKHQSTIDFTLTRRHHADGLARQARPHPHINFSPWRLGGRHLAIASSIPLHPGWTCASVRRPAPQTRYNKMQLDQEARLGGPRIQALRTALQEYLHQVRDPSPELVNKFLLRKVIFLFPKQPTPREPRAWQMPVVQGAVSTMWQARRELRQIRQVHCTALRACMEAFKKYTVFIRAYKLLKQQDKTARKALLNKELALAAEGEILRDTEEHHTIVRHFEQLFQSLQEPEPNNIVLSTTLQVTEKDLYEALQHTKYGKAVPRSSAPSSAVKCCADLLAQALVGSVNASLNGQSTPELWVNNGPVELVVRGPYTVPSIDAEFSINFACYGMPTFRLFAASPASAIASAPFMEQTGAEALQEVRQMFPHLAARTGQPEAPDADMSAAPALGRRDREESSQETPEKYPRPAGKGQAPPTGKSAAEEAPTTAPVTGDPAPKAAASSPAQQRSQQGQQAGKTNSGRVRQWTQEEWDSWTSWGQNNRELTTKELQREVENLRENVRLLARISMRHEDELSQKRTETETDFILTLEVAPADATPDQEGKVNNSLRLTLFIGLLMYYELKVHEATASAESLEHLAQLGYLRQLEGNPVWNYLRWSYDKEELETSEQPPLPDAELRSLLTVLKASIGAPGVLLRFHSSRKLVEQHKSAVTFFLGIGMRDPQARICYRALQQLCFSSSTQLIKMRLKPVKMERQPLVKILQEKFPAPPARSEEQRVTFLARTQQQWRKGKGRGKGSQQEGRGRGSNDHQEREENSLEAAARSFKSQ
ncbi:unnamed protein product, partial [Symbiodinium necroappetens]